VTLPDATDITSGNRFSCAVRSSGPTVCWGLDDSTQLGNGNPASNSNVPVTVSQLSN
jgi:alpha-tubulin suppressor-like RCC1 family protein